MLFGTHPGLSSQQIRPDGVWARKCSAQFYIIEGNGKRIVNEVEPVSTRSAACFLTYGYAILSSRKPTKTKIDSSSHSESPLDDAPSDSLLADLYYQKAPTNIPTNPD